MANTITLETLRTRCRERADMENSEFISSTELLSYINSSYGELYDILVSKFEDYYTTSRTFTIASGANTETLPTDFYKLRGVDFKIDANNWITVTKFNFAHRNVLNRSVTRSHAGIREVQYRIVGNELIIEPEDNAPGDYKLWYTPIYTPLVSESDTVDGLNGWEEYIIIDVAIKMLSKEESSVTHLDREKAIMLNRIESMAQNRDSDQPEKITDMDFATSNYTERIF